MLSRLKKHSLLCTNTRGSRCVCREYRRQAKIADEAQRYISLRHPHLVRYVECCQGRGVQDVIVVVRYCEGGSLASEVERARLERRELGEAAVVPWIAQLTSALEYLHGRSIVHGQLSPGKVFLSKARLVKLGSLGFACAMDHAACAKADFLAAAMYASPESFQSQDEPLTTTHDIWSLGCVFYELASLHAAFAATSFMSLAQKITLEPLPKLPPVLSEASRRLCEAMLARDPGQRASAQSLLQQPPLCNVLLGEARKDHPRVAFSGALAALNAAGLCEVQTPRSKRRSLRGSSVQLDTEASRSFKCEHAARSNLAPHTSALVGLSGSLRHSSLRRSSSCAQLGGDAHQSFESEHAVPSNLAPRQSALGASLRSLKHTNSLVQLGEDASRNIESEHTVRLSLAPRKSALGRSLGSLKQSSAWLSRSLPSLRQASRNSDNRAQDSNAATGWGLEQKFCSSKRMSEED